MDLTLDVTQKLMGLDGKALRDTPVADEDGKMVPGPEVELRAVCINALVAPLETDKGQSGEDKLTNWSLAKRLQDHDEVVLEPEELTKIKDRIGKAFGASVVGPAFLILNGTPAGEQT